MPKLDIPLQLSPVFKPKIWGQHNLEPLFIRPVGATGDPPSRRGYSDSPIDPNDLIGEVWITDEGSRFLNGPCAGLTLKEASQNYGAELHGSAWQDARFPLLAKYIYTNDCSRFRSTRTMITLVFMTPEVSASARCGIS